MYNRNKLTTIDYLSYKYHAKYTIAKIENKENFNKCFVQKPPNNYFLDYCRKMKINDKITSMWNNSSDYKI